MMFDRLGDRRRTRNGLALPNGQCEGQGTDRNLVPAGSVSSRK
jgi:hypothetical protein